MLNAPLRLLLFASGSGSNAGQLLAHFALPAAPARVVGLLSNNATARALERARAVGVPAETFDRAAWRAGQVLHRVQTHYRPDWLVLAGFLWLVPPAFVAAYRGRILNIHPALLPRFGGKGMHGHHVHEAVLAAGVHESGITIHFVDEHYDAGSVVFQARCPVLPTDTAATLAARVLALEHRYLPLVTEALVRGQEPQLFVRRHLPAALVAAEMVLLPAAPTSPAP